jgi:hypothetical protein
MAEQISRRRLLAGAVAGGAALGIGSAAPAWATPGLRRPPPVELHRPGSQPRRRDDRRRRSGGPLGGPPAGRRRAHGQGPRGTGSGRWPHAEPSPPWRPRGGSRGHLDRAHAEPHRHPGPGGRRPGVRPGRQRQPGLLLVQLRETDPLQRLHPPRHGPSGPQDRRRRGPAVTLLDQMATQVPVASPYDAPDAAEWDRQTPGTWFRALTTHPETLAVASAALEALLGAEMRDVSLLFTVAYIATATDGSTPGTFERLIDTGGGAQAQRFVQGAQEISIRVAAALGDAVVLDSPVRRIEQTGGGVTVYSDRLTVDASHVVVAIPPTLAGRIDYQPILPRRPRCKPPCELGRGMAQLATPADGLARATGPGVRSPSSPDDAARAPTARPARPRAATPGRRDAVPRPRPACPDRTRPPATAR